MGHCRAVLADTVPPRAERLSAGHAPNGTKQYETAPAADLTHEKCPRNTFGASRRFAREMVTVVRHGKWVVDDVAGRDHR
jgi:hypothetical protein